MSEAIARSWAEERVWGKRHSSSLGRKTSEREELGGKYEQKLVVSPELSRSLVSFQSNKREFTKRYVSPLRWKQELPIMCGA